MVPFEIVKLCDGYLCQPALFEAVLPTRGMCKDLQCMFASSTTALTCECQWAMRADACGFLDGIPMCRLHRSMAGSPCCVGHLASVSWPPKRLAAGPGFDRTFKHILSVSVTGRVSPAFSSAGQHRKGWRAACQSMSHVTVTCTHKPASVIATSVLNSSPLLNAA